MRKIDFHHNVKDRLVYAYSVAKMLRKRQLTLAIWCTNKERLDALDALLWTAEPTGFLPHVRAEDPNAAETPIVLSDNLSALSADVLLLLDDQLPPDWETAFERFDRIIDVVSTDETELLASRERWRAYKRAGAPLEAYNRQG